MFKTIVWATDGSEAADLALPYAKAIAGEQGASLHVVHCVEHLMGPRAGGLPAHADEEELKAKVKQQAQELSEEGIDVSVSMEGGSTLTGSAHMIADAARKLGADLIIVGTRGHTPIAGLVLGGVTQRLLHIAPCPVMAVPAGPRSAEGETAGQAATAAGS